MKKFQTPEEYDRCIADGVKDAILKTCEGFEVDKSDIDQLLMQLKGVGCTGIKVDEFKRRYMGQRLNNCFDNLIKELHKNWGGICLYTGIYEGQISIERMGRIYLGVYFPEVLDDVEK